MTQPHVRITSRLFAPEVAAAAFRLRTLAQAFADSGCRVEVLTTRPPASAAPAEDGSIRVRRWPALRDENGNIRGYLQYLSFDLPLVLRALAGGRPDLYVVEPPPTTGLAIRLVTLVQRRPYVWFAADIWSEAAGAAGAPPWVTAVLRGVESWVLRGATTVLSISDGVTSRLGDLGVRPQQIVTVGNGIDTSVFSPGGDAVREEEPYFVYTGTMSEWQGAGVFIEALAEHRRGGGTGRLVFLGQGSELPHLRELAGRLAPGAVEFPGVVPPAEAARWLRGARAALVSIRPGLGYDFAKPTKIYAATGCGTPVVFAGVGASAELVASQGLGWAVDHDAASVAAALAEAASGVRPDAGHLVSWTEDNASLVAACRSAVEAVLDRAAVARGDAEPGSGPAPRA